MAPVIRALACSSAIEQAVLLTGQHKGLSGIFDGLDPSILHQLDTDLRDLSVADLRGRLREAIGDWLAYSRPDMVLVQGDTTSALAGALAAEDRGIALAHIEAGLRSFDFTQPWPEEHNRVAIDAIADILFAPTEVAAANLAAEPAVSGEVHVTGNSGIDALLDARRHLSIPPVPASSRKIILATSHRRENDGDELAGICTAMKRLVEELPVEILFLLHSNRHKRRKIETHLTGVPNLRLLAPVSHMEMIELQLRSWAILTDSGGLQEEGPALGRPVLVMREVTERIEAPSNVELVGTQPGLIIAAVHRLLMDEVHYARMARPVLPFGDGRAAPRIAALIEDWLTDRGRKRDR